MFVVNPALSILDFQKIICSLSKIIVLHFLKLLFLQFFLSTRGQEKHKVKNLYFWNMLVESSLVKDTGTRLIV